jgi:predicted enzyme related to lactoylglutathione lyase
MIKDIAFTAYPSNDVAGTRAWYEEKLGLIFAGPYVEEGVEKYNESHFGSGCFSVMASEWVGREPGSAAGVVFEVEDIEKATRSLRGKGVMVEDVYEGPVCKQVSFSDPEGNKVTLHQKTVSG